MMYGILHNLITRQQFTAEWQSSPSHFNLLPNAKCQVCPTLCFSYIVSVSELAETMWVSRFSGLGVLAIKKLIQGKLVCLPRTQHIHVSSPRKQALLQLPPQTHRYFCTASAIDSCKDINEEKTINVTFVETDGTEKDFKVPIGISMLEAALSNDIELEGACEGSCACSTCHIVVMDVDYYNRLLDPTDEENDMLDLAFGLTETSRLGCQIVAKPELDGIRFALPGASRNFAVDGFKQKPL